MLDKFRDLSFTAKIAVMFSTVVVAIGALIGLGLGIKFLVGTDAIVNPTESPSASASTTASNEPEPSESVDQAIVDDTTVKGLSDGYLMSEDFFMAVCNIDGGSYSSYVKNINKYLASDSNVTPMSESTYNSIEYQTCEIHAGNAGETGALSNGHFDSNMATTITTKLKGIDQETVQPTPVDVEIGKENGKWVVYAVTLG